MTKPRKQQISLNDTLFYPCVSRYVCRAFLCGFDQLSGRSFEHRRQQIQDDMLRLASVFYIDLAAFCVMSNHHRLLLHVRRDDALSAPNQRKLRKPGYAQVTKGETPFVHVVSLSIRRTFRCGFDQQTGQSFDHRKQWIEDENLWLVGVFVLNAAAYAVISSHFQVVLRIDIERSLRWSNDEVIKR